MSRVLSTLIALCLGWMGLAAVSASPAHAADQIRKLALPNPVSGLDGCGSTWDLDVMNKWGPTTGGYNWTLDATTATATVEQSLITITRDRQDVNVPDCDGFLKIPESFTVTAFDNDKYGLGLPSEFLNKTYTVTGIGKSAFSNGDQDSSCNDDIACLIEVTIPRTVVSIGDYAFYNLQSLRKVTIEGSSTTCSSPPPGGYASDPDCNSRLAVIGKSAFSHSIMLSRIVLPPALQWVGVNAFADLTWGWGLEQDPTIDPPRIPGRSVDDIYLMSTTMMAPPPVGQPVYTWEGRTFAGSPFGGGIKISINPDVAPQVIHIPSSALPSYGSNKMAWFYDFPAPGILEIDDGPHVTAVNTCTSTDTPATAPCTGPATAGESGGETITVSGRYFTGARGVTIGGTSVPFKVVSDTLITATLPASDDFDGDTREAPVQVLGPTVQWPGTDDIQDRYYYTDNDGNTLPSDTLPSSGHGTNNSNTDVAFTYTRLPQLSVSISGETFPGGTITATPSGDLSGFDAIPGSSLEYVWYDNETVVQDGPSATWKVTAANDDNSFHNVAVTVLETAPGYSRRLARSNSLTLTSLWGTRTLTQGGSVSIQGRMFAGSTQYDVALVSASGTSTTLGTVTSLSNGNVTGTFTVPVDQTVDQSGGYALTLTPHAGGPIAGKYTGISVSAKALPALTFLSSLSGAANRFGAFVGVPTTQQIPVAGGLEPYHFSVVDPQDVPDWVTLSSDFATTGTFTIDAGADDFDSFDPSAPPTFTVQVQDSQATPYTAQNQVQLVLYDSQLSISSNLTYGRSARFTATHLAQTLGDTESTNGGYASQMLTYQVEVDGRPMGIDPDNYVYNGNGTLCSDSPEKDCSYNGSGYLPTYDSSAQLGPGWLPIANGGKYDNQPAIDFSVAHLPSWIEPGQHTLSLSVVNVTTNQILVSDYLSQTFTIAAPAITADDVDLGTITYGNDVPSAMAVPIGGTAPYTCVAHDGDALPAGLTVDRTSCALSYAGASPLAPGDYDIAVDLADSTPGTAAVARVAFTLRVEAPTTQFITDSALPDATVGNDYTTALTASGGTGSYSYALTSGALPAGLALDSDGTLHGRPTAAGAFAFTVKATDQTPVTPSTATQQFTMTVDPASGGDDGGPGTSDTGGSDTGGSTTGGSNTGGSATQAASAHITRPVAVRGKFRVGKRLRARAPKFTGVTGTPTLTYTWYVGKKVAGHRTSLKVAKRYRGKRIRLSVVVTWFTTTNVGGKTQRVTHRLSNVTKAVKVRR